MKRATIIMKCQNYPNEGTEFLGEIVGDTLNLGAKRAITIEKNGGENRKNSHEESYIHSLKINQINGLNYECEICNNGTHLFRCDCGAWCCHDRVSAFNCPSCNGLITKTTEMAVTDIEEKKPQKRLSQKNQKSLQNKRTPIAQKKRVLIGKK